MYDRVLYDRIAQNGKPVPNGMDHPNTLDQFEKSGEDWLRFSYLNHIPEFPLDRVALTHESSSGVYPICIREACVINSFSINSLLYIAGERTVSLIRSGDFKLCWFVEKEPPKDVAQIFEIDEAMSSWGITNYSIFTNLPLKTLTRFSKRAYASVSHELNVGIPQNESSTYPVREPKRFNVFMHTDNIYDWRLFFLDLLNRAGVIQNSVLSFKSTAPMIDTKSIHNDEIKSYLRRNEMIIRSRLTELAHGYVYYPDVFANTTFSIVIEGYLNYSTAVRYTFITEKTLRPILNSHPFIVMGQAHSLPYLRERGYLTFHPLIDETYDQIDNDFLRMKAVTAEIARINALTPEAYKKLLQKIEPIIEHNVAQAKRNIDTYWRRIFEYI